MRLIRDAIAVRLYHDALATKSGTLRNFKIQGCGTEILRLAHFLLWEAGIRVCAPVHDAFLIECCETDLEEVVWEAQQQMERASGIVLEGFRIRTEARLLRHPDRFVEVRGEGMWNHILNIASRLNSNSRVGRSIYRSLTSPCI